MRLTDNAKFIHCLPVRRNVEVSDAVLDAPGSLIIQEAGQPDVFDANGAA